MPVTLNETVRRVHSLSNIVRLPEFVKKAAVTEDTSSIDDTLFADYSVRQLPCHTKTATYLSALTLFGDVYESGGKFNEKQARVRDRLMGFVRYWKLEDDVANMLEDFTKNAAVKEEELEKDYAFDFQYGDEKVELYPMPNAVSVKMAADGMVSHRENFPYHVRKEAAQKILKKASEFNAPLNPQIMDILHQTAGKWGFDKGRLLNGLERRIKLASFQKRRECPNLEDATDKMNDLIEYVKYDKEPDHMKIAAAVEGFDLDTGLYLKYAWGLDMPEQLMYTKPEEKNNSDKIQLQTGKTFKLAEVIGAGIAPLQALGEDFVDVVTDQGIINIEKVARVLPTLPCTPDAALLEQALQYAGVKPCNA